MNESLYFKTLEDEMSKTKAVTQTETVETEVTEPQTLTQEQFNQAMELVFGFDKVTRENHEDYTEQLHSVIAPFKLPDLLAGMTSNISQEYSKVEAHSNLSAARRARKTSSKLEDVAKLLRFELLETRDRVSSQRREAFLALPEEKRAEILSRIEKAQKAREKNVKKAKAKAKTKAKAKRTRKKS